MRYERLLLIAFILLVGCGTLAPADVTPSLPPTPGASADQSVSTLHDQLRQARRTIEDQYDANPGLAQGCFEPPALDATVQNGQALLTTEWRGRTQQIAYDKIVVAIGFDPTAPLDLLDPALRPREPIAELRRMIDYNLCLPGIPIHVPMLAGLAQGPGFPNLSCLGLLADRVLARYLSPLEPLVPSDDELKQEDFL